MKIVRVNLKERSYKILIGSGLLKRIGDIIESLGDIKKVVLITNPVVFSFYGKDIAKILQKRFSVVTAIVPDGERAKSLKWAKFLYDEMIKEKIERGSIAI